MSETANNTGQLCTQEEFERLESIHTRFKQFLKDPKRLSGDDHEKLFDDIDTFSQRIIEIGQKCGIDMSDKIETLFDILAEW
jgi:hypothetical protein